MAGRAKDVWGKQAVHHHAHGPLEDHGSQKKVQNGTFAIAGN
jgi:hypothetical protein